ncbi:unnamed protein product, partial [Mycena citricolor]
MNPGARSATSTATPSQRNAVAPNRQHHDQKLDAAARDTTQTRTLPGRRTRGFGKRPPFVRLPACSSESKRSQESTGSASCIQCHPSVTHASCTSRAETGNEMR